MKWIHHAAASLAAIMWLLVSEAKVVPDDFLVEGLGEIEPAFAHFDGKMYSGRLPMDNNNRHGELMFWLFAPYKTSIGGKNLGIWLNGGPGCSAFFAGVFFEHGPVTVPQNPAGTCCVSQDEPLVPNPHSWARATHIMYVEQPVNVGFSDGDTLPKNEKELSADFYAFLQNFYSVFTEYTNYNLYLFGESYAGMYVPSIAHYIYEQNKKLHKTEKIKILLAGIGIGNGLLDSRVQGPIRIDYAYWHGMIDSYTRDVLKEVWERCMDDKPMKDPFHSFNPPDDCGMLSALPLATGKNAIPDNPNGPNVYDITTWDPYAGLSGNNSISRFYNNAAVKSKLHAPLDTVWMGCMPGAGRRRRRLVATLLLHDKPISTVPYIATLLDGGVRVVMYNGDRDMACNAIGTEQLLNDMKWHGSKEWYSTPRGLWAVQSEPAGYVKSHQNLDFVVLYNSGHLAPYNNPVHSLDLVERFLTNSSFYNSDLPNFEDHLQKHSLPLKEKSAMYSKSTGKYATNQEAMLLSPSASTLWTDDSKESSFLSAVVPLVVAFSVGFSVALVWQRRWNVGGYQRL